MKKAGGRSPGKTQPDKTPSWIQAYHMFSASRDFLLSWSILEAHAQAALATTPGTFSGSFPARVRGASA